MMNENQTLVCQPHVQICVPSTGFHESGMSMALAALTMVSTQAGIVLSFGALDMAGISRSRNILARSAFDAQATHILWIDSDMVFPPDALIRLLNHGKDIVGCPYPMRTPPYALTGKPIDCFAFEGLAPMEFLPGGFMLVRTAIYANLPAPWYWETYGHECPEAGEPDDMPATQERSEDVNFCLKARGFNYEIWGDLDLMRQLVHVGKLHVSLGNA
jgi:hypothetical protein